LDRATKTEAWSRETLGKGFRATEQYKADLLDMKQAEIALKEAKGMEERLLKFTSRKILMSLESKLKAIRADQLAQEASFGLEDDRLRRLEKMVENCTIRAPKDGIIVYANQANAWSGQTELQIQEGTTVREGQTLFGLPDPKHMRVKVKVNESKMSSIRPGQKAEIRIEAFPNMPLTGTVTDITAIPAPMGMVSDVKIYFAMVTIDTGGFNELRPGMTAEVAFFVDSEAKTTRIPVQSVRWVRDKAFAAVAAKVGDETRWDWQPITVGLINENYAEVLSGLTPGQKVVSNPNPLPPPVLKPSLETAESDRRGAPRG
jgi:HlyD family secretion protein